MNIKNIVGQKTLDYIQQNNLTLSGVKNMKLKTNAKTNTPVVVENSAMVIRVVNGKKIQLTPSANFDKELAYRLNKLKTEFKMLARLTGKNYETTAEKIAFAEDMICTWGGTAIESLRNPAKAKQADDEILKAIKKL